MSRAVPSRSAIVLLGALLASGLQAMPPSLAAQPDPLETLTRRLDDARGALARRSPASGKAGHAGADRARALDDRDAELVALLEAQASELDGYASTAPLQSARLARARATDARLEALDLALAAPTAPVASLALDRAAPVASLVAALTATGPEADARAFALVLGRARARGEGARMLELLDARLATHAPELAALVKTHAGRVLLLVLEAGPDDRTDLLKSKSSSQRADAADRQALALELGPRGLDVATATGGRALGATATGLELVLDRTGRVRGVDLVGAARTALVRALLQEDTTDKNGERP